MDMNRFYVENGKIALNTYEIVVRQYSDLKKNEYFDHSKQSVFLFYYNR